MNTNIAAARQTGCLTFFEIADQDGVQAATDLMIRVVRMTPLLEEADVRNWRKAYEEQEREAIAQRDEARRNA